MRPGGNCPIEGCVARKERYSYMCSEHWAMCAGDLRGQLNHAWRVAKVGGDGMWRAFVDARDEAIRYVNKKEAEKRAGFLAADTGLSGEGAAL